MGYIFYCQGYSICYTNPRIYSDFQLAYFSKSVSLFPTRTKHIIKRLTAFNNYRIFIRSLFLYCIISTLLIKLNIHSTAYIIIAQIISAHYNYTISNLTFLSGEGNSAFKSLWSSLSSSMSKESIISSICFLLTDLTTP